MSEKFALQMPGENFLLHIGSSWFQIMTCLNIQTRSFILSCRPSNLLIGPYWFVYMYVLGSGHLFGIWHQITPTEILVSLLSNNPLTMLRLLDWAAPRDEKLGPRELRSCLSSVRSPDFLSTGSRNQDGKITTKTRTQILLCTTTARVHTKVGRLELWHQPESG